MVQVGQSMIECSQPSPVIGVRECWCRGVGRRRGRLGVRYCNTIPPTRPVCRFVGRLLTVEAVPVAAFRAGRQGAGVRRLAADATVVAQVPPALVVALAPKVLQRPALAGARRRLPLACACHSRRGVSAQNTMLLMLGAAASYLQMWLMQSVP